jgi:hypothetical protein
VVIVATICAFSFALQLRLFSGLTEASRQPTGEPGHPRAARFGRSRASAWETSSSCPNLKTPDADCRARFWTIAEERLARHRTVPTERQRIALEERVPRK